MKRNSVLLTILALSVALLVLWIDVVAAGSSGYLTRVTASDNDRASFEPSLSAGGTVVAFTSDSDFLGQGIPDNQLEVWLYDTATKTLARITTASDPDRGSWSPSISADGTVVAFVSESDLLGQGVPADLSEVWLCDTSTMTYTRVTTAYHDNRSSGYPSLSADARVVALSSGSDFLDQGIAPGQWEIWLYDTATMTYTRVTTASDDYRSSWSPSLSSDGSVVAFTSDCDFLDQGIAPGQWEIWLYDTATMTYTRVTTASHDYRDSSRPSLSADGSVVAFVSDSDFLSQGIPNEQLEIWLYDTATMTYTRVTTATGSGERTSWNPILSADGSVVAFSSDSDFLGQGIPPGQLEIWLCDTSTMTYTRVTAASDGRDSWLPPSLSADGSVVAFTSDSDFLGQGISPGQWEIWLYRRFGPEHWLYLPLVMRDAP